MRSPTLSGANENIALFLIILVTFLCYYPGLSGDFLFDDAWNIQRNKNIQITNFTIESLNLAAFSSTSGLFQRPISMLSFAVNHYLSGLDPFYYKITNLLIHLLNGLALFFLTKVLLKIHQTVQQPKLSENAIKWLSLAVSSAWLLHPINLTSVLYIVQRMNSLSALFVIIGLVCYAHNRLRMINGKKGILRICLCTALCLPFAILSKENGALLPLFLLVIEFTLVGFKYNNKIEKNFLISFYSLLIALPLLGLICYFFINPEFISNTYRMRDFSLYERLLTETGVIFFYLKLILLPSNSALSLFHDDFLISHSLLSPPTTLLAVIGILALIISTIVFRKRAPLLSFAVLFFLAGHAMESTIFGLELVHEHRNYLPLYGILIALIYYLTYPFTYEKSFNARVVVTSIFILLLGITTATRASYWGNEIEFSLAEVSHHPLSPRANHQIGRIYASLYENNKEDIKADQHLELARKHFINSAKYSDAYTDGLFALIVLQSSNAIPIETEYFELLLYRLANKPFTHNAANQIKSLFKCTEQRVCNLNNSDLQKIISASLSNATLSGISRNIVLKSQRKLHKIHSGKNPNGAYIDSKITK